MEYEIIFYHSEKTAELERMLSRRLSALSLRQSDASAASSPEELSVTLSAALKRSSVIFIIGGIDGGIQSTDRVMEKLLRPKKGRSADKHDLGNGASLTESSGQCIVLLPDSEKDNEAIIPDVMKLLQEIYDLKKKEEDIVDQEKIAEELDRELSQNRRVRVSPSGGTAEKHTKSRLGALRATIAVLVLLAVAQFGAAAYIFVTQL